MMTTALSAALPWFANEDAIALHEVPSELRPRTTGQLVATSTVRRWAGPGLCGVRLRTFPLGGRGRATTKQELARFLAAIAEIRGIA